jgi:hypothetical protein
MRSPRVEVQLKATAQNLLTEDYLSFPLPVKNYDELREPSMVPRLLVVLRLPATLDQWLDQNEEALISRHGAYWLSLLGMPASDNTYTVTVHLPRTQLLTKESLQGLMERAARKEPL